MKRLLLFILPILIIIATALVIFGTFQVRFEEERLMDELKRKARAVAESLDLAAKDALESKNLKRTQALAETFQNRERLQGCVIYDKDGNILALTERFSDWRDKEKPYLKAVLEGRLPDDALDELNGYSLYRYALPIIDDENQILGAVEVIYDTAYIFANLSELWKRLSVTLFALIVSILIISLIIQRQIFTLPVQQLTEWFTNFQKGETDEQHPIKDKGDLGKLAGEVEQVALSLRVARRAISDEASKRLKKDEIWTERKLRDLIHAKLGDNALVVVSNREPYMHVVSEPMGKPKCIRPASGVVPAINPILFACGGIWGAHGRGIDDKTFTNSKDKLGVPPEDNRYILKRVWLTKEEEAGYYYGFANEGLWPLCHITHTRPIFRA